MHSYVLKYAFLVLLHGFVEMLDLDALRRVVVDIKAAYCAAGGSRWTCIYLIIDVTKSRLRRATARYSNPLSTGKSHPLSPNVQHYPLSW